MNRAILTLLLLSLCACSSSRPQLLGTPPLSREGVRTVDAVAVGYVMPEPSAQVWETTIAISPANPLVAVAAGMRRQTRGYSMQTYWTDDGGLTWTVSDPLSLQTAQWTYVRQGDPVVAFDRTGVAYATSLVAWPHNDYDRSGILLWRSTDGGKTWSAPLPVVERVGDHFDDKEWMGIDTTGGPRDGSIYLSWLRADSNINYTRVELVFIRSTDGGLTWSEEKVIGNGGGPQFAIGPEGEVHVTYAEGLQMRSITSRDGGETFETPVVIDTIAGPPGNLAHTGFFLYPFASTASDRSNGPYRGHLYTTWAGSADAYPNHGGSLPGTTWLSRSTDGGRSWSAPVPLSNRQSGRDAMFPSLAVDPGNGEVVVAWLDRSDDPENRTARIYATRSTDGGETFSLPRAFTSPIELNATFVGHYNGTAAEGGVRLTAFSDASGRMGIARLVFPSTERKRRAVRN